ncbi:hypothetical protein LCGC14_0449040 [marine sediment metagenome]|uniref:PD-(D/E)XK endonuclease-like domain-containing protein n=1 Tax=marine sediment metagenome TaxID=412755 RepID=A0A0F9VSH2_9ZZZZ
MVLEETKERTVHHNPPPFFGYWTSSQLGCERRCFLIARGIEGDFVEMAVTDEGRLHEDDVIAKLQVKGIIVYDRQVELRHPTLPLRGHPDGRVIVSPELAAAILSADTYLLDVKSMDRAFYLKAIKDFKGNFPHLYRQLQGYSLMSDDHESIYVPIKNRATGEIHELVLAPDEEEWIKIETMITLLSNANSDPNFDYKYLHCPSAESISGKYCSYRNVGMCEHQTNIPDVTDAEVVQALSSYEEGKTLNKQGEERKDSAKKTMIAYLKNNGVTSMKIGNKIVMVTKEGRRSCDLDKLKELAPDIYKLVAEETPYEKFQTR